MSSLYTEPCKEPADSSEPRSSCVLSVSHSFIHTHQYLPCTYYVPGTTKEEVKWGKVKMRDMAVVAREERGKNSLCLY